MKTNQFLRQIAFGLVTILTANGAFAQGVMEKAVKASPAATATGKIGAAAVTVKYSSPLVKGRAIWGGLVPYGQVWRAGADEATTIEFSQPVTVEGKALPAGKYGFFVIPTAKQWTIIFNKVPNQWGAFKYDQKQDALRVMVAPRPAAMAERLAYQVTPKGLTLHWEKLAALVVIK